MLVQWTLPSTNLRLQPCNSRQSDFVKPGTCSNHCDQAVHYRIPEILHECKYGHIVISAMKNIRVAICEHSFKVFLLDILMLITLKKFFFITQLHIFDISVCCVGTYFFLLYKFLVKCPYTCFIFRVFLFWSVNNFLSNTFLYVKKMHQNVSWTFFFFFLHCRCFCSNVIKNVPKSYLGACQFVHTVFPLPGVSWYLNDQIKKL